MKKLVFSFFMVFGLSSALFGFATITAPAGGDSITISSNVADCDVYLNGVQIGKMSGGNFTYKATRDGAEKVLTFKKDGYADATITLSKKLAPVFFVNVLIGGALGSSTDSITSKNFMEYSPNQYFVNMIAK